MKKRKYGTPMWQINMLFDFLSWGSQPEYVEGGCSSSSELRDANIQKSKWD